MGRLKGWQTARPGGGGWGLGLLIQFAGGDDGG